ncbi:MAG: PD-(D/E)XK nuclease family protein [Candidatus Aenigmatarchaeota archaeon]
MLENIVDSYIAEKRAEQIRPHDKFRVSDAGRCHLMRFWKRQGKPATDEPDARTQRVFEVGHVFHVWLQDLLQKTGLLLHKEYRVEDMHRIGHIDAIVRVGEALILYDFKTVHSRKFHHRRREGGNGDMHYAMQAWTYAQMLPFGVEDIRIAYISKDDLCIDEVSVLDIDDISEYVKQDWFSLIDSWVRQEEPRPNPADWECKYCIYKSSCQYAKERV